MNKANGRDLERRVARLKGQNDRLRELIEMLAGRSALAGRSDSAAGTATEIKGFEVFAPFEEQRMTSPRSGIGPASPETIIHDNRWFPVYGQEVKPLDPSPGWRCLAAHGAQIRLGFDLRGIDEDLIESAVVEIEERQLSDRDFIPVFITDSPDFDVFRFRGYVFEYVPAAISRAPAKHRAECRYLKQRLELIKAKWNLRDIIDLSD